MYIGPSFGYLEPQDKYGPKDRISKRILRLCSDARDKEDSTGPQKYATSFFLGSAQMFWAIVLHYFWGPGRFM